MVTTMRVHGPDSKVFLIKSQETIFVVECLNLVILVIIVYHV